MKKTNKDGGLKQSPRRVLQSFLRENEDSVHRETINFGKCSGRIEHRLGWNISVYWCRKTSHWRAHVALASTNKKFGHWEGWKSNVRVSGIQAICSQNNEVRWARSFHQKHSEFDSSGCMKKLRLDRKKEIKSSSSSLGDEERKWDSHIRDTFTNFCLIQNNILWNIIPRNILTSLCNYEHDYWINLRKRCTAQSYIILF